MVGATGVVVGAAVVEGRSAEQTVSEKPHKLISTLKSHQDTETQIRCIVRSLIVFSTHHTDHYSEDTTITMNTEGPYH